MNPIADYRKSTGLTMRGLASVLGLRSAGHAADLVNGRYKITIPLAKRLAKLTGRPWHELMDAADAS